MILAVDTSIGSAVAVVDPSGVVRAEADSADPLGHAEVIGLLLRRALDDAGIAATDVTHVAAGMGPGPFTGLRIGIAAARAFALARRAVLVPVVSHDAAALALLDPDAGAGGSDVRDDPDAGTDPTRAAVIAAPAGAHRMADASAPQAAPFAIVTDARRRELAYTVYGGLDADGLPERVSEPALAPRGDLDARLADAAARRADTSRIRAGDIGRTAVRFVTAGRRDPHREPLYLRSPDVTLGHAPKRVTT